MSTVVLCGGDVLVGELPATWETIRPELPERTPGSVFVQRVLERGSGPLPRRGLGSLYQVNCYTGRWFRYELWWTMEQGLAGERGATKSGRRVWRRHKNMKPTRLP